MEQLNYTTISKKNQYKHLSHSERIKIQNLYMSGMSIYAIAKAISRDYKTVQREFKIYGSRNQVSIANRILGIKKYKYSASISQKERNKKYIRPRYYNKYEHFIKYTQKNLTVYVTLEDLMWNYKKEFKTHPCPCLKTLYNWTHKKIIQLPYGAKPVKTQKKNVKTEKIEGRKPISMREELYGFKMNDYSHRGHYEIDTIYNGDKLGGLLTFNERSTRKLYAVKIKDRKASTINKALRILIKQIGSHNIFSITSDNGTEFSYSAVIKASFNIRWFYCDPYSSWQRGQNEGFNRDIRKYYPKGTLFNRILDSTIHKTIDKINNKPRRIFTGLSATEYTMYCSRVRSLKLDTENQKNPHSNDILCVA
ncbi:MAG: IS30 family transposase [Mycoplasmatales bacterium]